MTKRKLTAAQKAAKAKTRQAKTAQANNAFANTMHQKAKELALHEAAQQALREHSYPEINDKRHEGVERETYPQWREVYPQVCEEYRQGTRFTLPKSNCIEHTHHAADVKVANDALAKMRAMLAGKAVSA